MIQGEHGVTQATRGTSVNERRRERVGHVGRVETNALLMAGGIVVLVVLLVASMGGVHRASPTKSLPASAITGALRQELESANLDVGTPLDGAAAPNFTLTDQNSHTVSLRQFQGKVVLIAFVDLQGGGLAPQSAQIMLDALADLPANAQSEAQLIAINVNGSATSAADAHTFAVTHDLDGQGAVLTGSPDQLQHVASDYHIAITNADGHLTYAPAIILIDSQGHERLRFTPSHKYGAIDLEGYAVATELAALLPHHASVNAALPPIHSASTTQTLTLPTLSAQGPMGSIALGPSNQDLVTFFFTSWTPDIQQHLVALNTYAAFPGAPRIVAIDIGSLEPNMNAPSAVLAELTQPLVYPVALDTTGALADAYAAQEVPWFALADPNGTVVSSVGGWVDPIDLPQVLAIPTQ